MAKEDTVSLIEQLLIERKFLLSEIKRVKVEIP